MPFKLKIDSINRSEKFMPEVLDDQRIFFINDPEQGALLCPSNEHFEDQDTPKKVLPLWSSGYKAYARAFAAELLVDEISLDDFFQSIYLNARDQGMLFGLNWDQGGAGIELSPESLYETMVDYSAEALAAEIVLDQKLFCILLPENGIYLTASENYFDEQGEAVMALPIWSARNLESASHFAEGLEIQEVDLALFVEEMLPQLDKDGLLLAFNWDVRGFAPEIAPMRFQQHLSEALKDKDS